jgi:predicted flap endonuclease-1-like 5' DNA nuclease
MTDVAQTNYPLLIIALLIGLAVGFWLFRAARRPRRSDRSPTDAPPAVPAPACEDGRGVGGEIAAATKDVAGEILGVEAHPEIPAATGPADNLQLLKGVGPKLASQLNQAGIIRFDQLAGMGETEIALLDARMGAFAGRLQRDRIVEQACYLARGDKDGFESRFGKLGGGG